MLKTNATWERRNFGCDAYEFKLDTNDCANVTSTITEMNLADMDNCFVTVKMPVGQIKMLHALESSGFNFMENQFRITRSLKNYQSPDLIKRLGAGCTQQEVSKTPSQWRAVADMLTDNIFTTDRVYLDPLLPSGTSAIRYKNWIMDLLDNPAAHLFLYYKDGVAIGFSLALYKDGYVDDLLAGVFEAFLSSGYGFLLFDAALKNYASLGFTKIETSISSNNFSIMKLYQFFDYEIISQHYVLRKYKGVK